MMYTVYTVCINYYMCVYNIYIYDMVACDEYVAMYDCDSAICLQCQELVAEAERVALELFLASQNEAGMHLGRGNVTPAHIGILAS